MNRGLLHLTRLRGRSRFGEAKDRFRLRLRASKPPSPPHGGGEGSCGGRFWSSLHLQVWTRIGAMNRGLLHLTRLRGRSRFGEAKARFRLRLRASKPPSPPPGGGEGSCIRFATRLLSLLALAACLTHSTAAAPARWWKGNLHTHSFWSDGDNFPEMIARW